MPNCINTTYWCVQIVGSSTFMEVSGTFGTINQPYTVTKVIDQTSGFTSQAYTLSIGNGQGGGYNNTNQGFMYAGATATFTVADSAWLASIHIYNGASSIADVNGTATTGLNTGTNAAANPVWLGVYSNGASAPFTGNITEVVVYPIAFNSTQYAAMTSNQRSFWGF